MQPEYLRHYGCQYIDEDDIQAVVIALKSPLLTGGPHVDEFEKALVDYTGANYALACGNCTQALQLAAHGLGIGRGVSVIVPSVTFLATANAPHLLGADVVFADVDPDSGLMEASHLEEALSRCPSKPVAVFPVHLAGQVMNIKAVHDVARRNGLSIIEDAAHAIGTTYVIDNKTYQVGDGAFSDVTAFSFHPVKHITTCEGGAVLVNDGALYERIKALRAHGMVRDPKKHVFKERAYNKDNVPNPWYYEMPDVGYNFRMTDIQAALGSSQLKKLPDFIAHRTRLRNMYEALIAPLSPFVRPTSVTPDCHAAWHIFVTLIDFEKLGKGRGDVMRMLDARGIGSQVHYIPVHLQPYYQEHSNSPRLPGAESYYAKTLTLPLHAHMKENDVEQVVIALREVLEL
jgi:UDP-4-amino-4,6-dideoxy-N-acetyl-beta-L-altrosamine transaminase